MITQSGIHSKNKKMLAIKITNMTVDDLTEILAIESSSFPTPWSRNLFLRELRFLAAYNLVARIKISDQEDIAGYIIFWIIAGEVHLQHLAVREDLRRSGIASRLIIEMMKLASNEEARWITLEVRKSNEAARMLYEKFGFIIKGVRRRYYSDTQEDALIMWADIHKSIKKIRNESD